MKNLGPRDGDPERIRVLFYHRISSTASRFERARDTVSERTFRTHLALLERWGYDAITFQDYNLYLQGTLSLPRKPVIITFDDGYRDVYTHAFPVMKEFGLRGVIFVVGERSMRTNEWDRGITPSYELLSNEEILEFHNAGFEIGAHSMHHVRLTDVQAIEAWEELYQARVTTESLLNAPVHTFAYPYGLVNEEVKKMALNAGYTVACAAFTGPPIFGTDLLEVRRIRIIDSQNPVVFWFQLQSVYLHYRFLWGQGKKLALRLFRRLAGLFNHHPEFVQNSDRLARTPRVHDVKSETRQ